MLLQILHINGTSDDTTLQHRGLQPSIPYSERVTIGNPRVVQSPVGYGMRFTAHDRVVFRYPVTDPIPCPFNITQCTEGLTLSLWLRGEIMSNEYKTYINIGSAFYMYRVPMQNRMDFSWYTHKEYRWWNTIIFPENEWVHVALIWDMTHTVSYLNGEKYREVARQSSTLSAVIGHEVRLFDSRPGNYSVGGLHFWSGRASPVFIWRLYQGLPDSAFNEWWLY